MRLPKEFVERKLSAALGARVTIDMLSVSVLGGSLDVTGAWKILNITWSSRTTGCPAR